MVQLPWFLSKDTAIMQLQTVWRSILNPFIAQAYLNGLLLKQVSLVSGANVVNHKLNRMQQGWVIADQNAVASIYRSQAFNDETLTLVSSATVTINLWVF